MTLKYDGGKPRWNLVPWKQLCDVVKVLTLGADKYSDDNWMTVTPLRERYFSAAMRHISDWWNGERLDKETGLPHISHAICCLLFLAWGDDNANEAT